MCYLFVEHQCTGNTNNNSAINKLLTSHAMDGENIYNVHSQCLSGKVVGDD